MKLTAWYLPQPDKPNLLNPPETRQSRVYPHIISQKLCLKWGHLRERSSTSRKAGTDSVRVLYNSLLCEHPIICSYVPTQLLRASLNKP